MSKKKLSKKEFLAKEALKKEAKVDQQSHKTDYDAKQKRQELVYQRLCKSFTFAPHTKLNKVE